MKAVLIYKAAINHRLGDAFSVQVRLIQHVFRLRRLQDVLLDEKFSDLLVVHQLVAALSSRRPL